MYLTALMDLSMLHGIVYFGKASWVGNIQQWSCVELLQNYDDGV